MNRRVEKPWGHELIWAHTDKYLGKILHIESGKRLSLQYHIKKDETIYVLNGNLLLEYGTSVDQLKCFSLKSGDQFRIEPGALHRMSAITDVDVAEVSTPELHDVVRIKDDYGRENIEIPA